MNVIALCRAGDVSVNLDAVTQVARDCLLARMEAVILQVQGDQLNMTVFL